MNPGRPCAVPFRFWRVTFLRRPAFDFRDATGASGHTGIYVYGYNLGGDYENNLTAERKLTSGPIDCTGKTRVQLSFWRWLGVEQSTHDHAAVRISTNGSTWTTLWQNTAQVADTSWQQMTFDISAIADNQPTVYLRWAMGPTDGLNQYCGWNIDDLALTGLSCESVLLPGDMNCDGLLNTADIAPFVLALCDPAAYAAEYPTCNILSGEFTDDELVDGRDIQGFVDVLLGP